MEEKFINDLLLIGKIFYSDTYKLKGILKKDIDLAEKELDYKFNNYLRCIYLTIGNENKLTKSKELYFYDLSKFKKVSQYVRNKYLTGIEFLQKSSGYKSSFSQYESNGKIRDIIMWNDKRGEDPGISLFGDVKSELLYYVFTSASSNMNNSIAVRGSEKKVLADLAEKYKFQKFESYVVRDDFEIQLYYSEEYKLFLSNISDIKNKIVISSNDKEIIKQITSSYKCEWLKEDGKKILNENHLCYESEITTSEEKFKAIYTVYYGEVPSLNYDPIFRLKEDVQQIIPEVMKYFYALFGKKQTIFSGTYRIPKLKELRSDDSKILIAEEEQGVCCYFYDLSDNAVYYSDDSIYEKMDSPLEDFLIYLLAVQGTGICSYQCMVDKSEDFRPFFRSFKVNETEIFVNKKRKILGFEYDSENVCIVSKKEADLQKFIDDSDICADIL